MKRIPLNVLDAYANKLSEKQINMLYENKVGKKYEKALFENLENNGALTLYLDEYTMASQLEANKVEVIMHLNENYSDIMNNISYKIDSDSILFSTKDRNYYRKLTEALAKMGIDQETMLEIRDIKF